jgi:hypothetical protein
MTGKFQSTSIKELKNGRAPTSEYLIISHNKMQVELIPDLRIDCDYIAMLINQGAFVRFS